MKGSSYANEQEVVCQLSVGTVMCHGGWDDWERLLQSRILARDEGVGEFSAAWL